MFSEITAHGVKYMTSPNIDCPHAFTTRFGGVSGGVFEALNLGQSLGDDLVSVKSNYNILCDTIGISIDDIVKSSQVHGNNVRIVTKKDCGKLFSTDTPAADGLITNEKNVALIVYTADCVPILLHDPLRNVICAIHAGWRGTALNIVGEAVQKMANEFKCSLANIKAAIGPCISKCCYETSQDVPDALHKILGKATDSCVVPRNGKYMVDLKEANNLMLKKAHVKDIAISDECTSCLSDKYWSHRKSNINRGSQASIIVNN